MPAVRIQTAWDAISLHTTPGIAAYKPLEVELLYDGVALDSLGVGYEIFPEDVRTQDLNRLRVPATKTSARTSSTVIPVRVETNPRRHGPACPGHDERRRRYVTLNAGWYYKRSNFYDQIQNSPFQNSWSFHFDWKRAIDPLPFHRPACPGDEEENWPLTDLRRRW